MKKENTTPQVPNCCHCEHSVMLDTETKITGKHLFSYAYKLEEVAGRVNVKEMAGCYKKGTIRNYQQAKKHCPLIQVKPCS